MKKTNFKDNIALFDISNFNTIKDNQNYYFIRALNMIDMKDIETRKILDKKGRIEKIRTDRERYEENNPNAKLKYTKKSTITLEEAFDHIKANYRKDTNCISLSSDANISISYGRGFYKDKYVLVRVPKKDINKKVICAGQYMLSEIEKSVYKYISKIENTNKEKYYEIIEKFKDIDKSQNNNQLVKIIMCKYKTNKMKNKITINKKIEVKPPVIRIKDYSVLNDIQNLEKNKIIAKLSLLERKYKMKPLIYKTIRNDFLIQTIESAFASLELLHYGTIKKQELKEIPKEIVNIFALVQQTKSNEKIKQTDIEKLKREVVNLIYNN